MSLFHLLSLLLVALLHLLIASLIGLLWGHASVVLILLLNCPLAVKLQRTPYCWFGVSQCLLKVDRFADLAISNGSAGDQGGIGMRTILIVILVLLLVGALPSWPYSTGWGYYPSGGLGLVLLVLLILAISGRL